jgi:hypothetical protein
MKRPKSFMIYRYRYLFGPDTDSIIDRKSQNHRKNIYVKNFDILKRKLCVVVPIYAYSVQEMPSLDIKMIISETTSRPVSATRKVRTVSETSLEGDKKRGRCARLSETSEVRVKYTAPVPVNARIFFAFPNKRCIMNEVENRFKIEYGIDSCKGAPDILSFF